MNLQVSLPDICARGAGEGSSSIVSECMALQPSPSSLAPVSIVVWSTTGGADQPGERRMPGALAEEAGNCVLKASEPYTSLYGHTPCIVLVKHFWGLHVCLGLCVPTVLLGAYGLGAVSQALLPSSIAAGTSNKTLGTYDPVVLQMSDSFVKDNEKIVCAQYSA